MAFVTYPLTGAGDTTIKIPTDRVVDLDFQYLKLTDGAAGSTLAILAKETTPGSTDAGMVVRAIGSTAFNQAVVGAVGITSGSSAVELTSAGSTRLVGRVDVNNPTTSVTITNPTTSVTITNPTSAVDAAATLTSAGSTRLAGRVTIDNPTTAVEANLSSQGSTRVVGRVDVNNPTTSVNVANPTTAVDAAATLTSAGSTRLAGQFTVANPTTAVEANLSSVGSTRLVGRVDVNNPTTSVNVANPTTSVNVANPTTSVTVTSGVILAAGSSANILGSVTLSGGTTANSVGSVALVAGSSANILGQVVQGPGSSANFWFEQSIPFSSGNLARTSVATTVDVSVVAANANRKALIIQNLSTLEIGLGFSTGAVTTALANVDWSLAARGSQNDKLVMGFSAPLFLGPIRGITLNSTAVVGSVKVLEFT